MLSARAQAFISIVSESQYEAEKFALIIGEPHYFLEKHRSGLEFLKIFIEDNPHISEDLVFLSEGIESYCPILLTPLFESFSDPSNQEIVRVLSSFLLLFYYVWAWSEGIDVLFIGIEDKNLYSHSARLWVEEEWDLWLASVYARNTKMAEVLVWSLDKFDHPVLFVGSRHVVSSPEEIIDIKKMSSNIPSDHKYLANGEYSLIGESLRSQGYGYVLLDIDEALSADSPNREQYYAAYRRLFEAQLIGDMREYINYFLKAQQQDFGVTVSPSIKTAVQLLKISSNGKRGGSTTGKSSGSATAESALKRIWNNRRLFLKWVKNNFSKDRRTDSLSHEEARKLVDIAKRLKLKIKSTPRGLAGDEGGGWGPHFHIEELHIPVRSGFRP